MNARFWVYALESWVKLSLRPGESVEWHHGGPHEEGYEFTTDRWELSGDGVTLYRSRSRRWADCDGPGSSWSEDFAAVSSIGPRDPSSYGYSPEVRIPDWQAGDAGQRDHYAEAMNY